MKKVLVLFITLFILTGCVNINSSSLDDVISASISKKSLKYNHSNSGYRYYLPKELRIDFKDDFNEIIKDHNLNYYLYIDLISYYNGIELDFTENKENYYSKIFNYQGQKGIVNIEQKNNDEFLIKVEFNYLNISSLVKKADINSVVTNMLLIVKSVSYNRDVIENILNDNILNNVEEQIKLFDKDSKNNDLLDIEEDIYTGEDYEFDPDMIN